MRLLGACIAILFISQLYALEYLSDGELEALSGYSSQYMQKEYDAAGNILFRRLDDEPCRFNQSENDDDVRVDCEDQLNLESDQLLTEQFQRFLARSLLDYDVEKERELDNPDDGFQELDLSARLEDFNYNHFMCDGMPDKGVVRFEGIQIRGEDGGDLRIRNRTRLLVTRDLNTGTEERVIESQSEEIRGVIGVDAIKIGMTEDDAKAAPSLGGIYITRIGGANVRISANED